MRTLSQKLEGAKRYVKHPDYKVGLAMLEEFIEDAKKLEAQVKNLTLHRPVVIGSVFLIEKGWIDPMENRKADGYKPFGYKMSEQEAKDFCELHGYWTDDDCWSIRYKPNKRMWKYRYKEIPYCP